MQRVLLIAAMFVDWVRVHGPDWAQFGLCMHEDSEYGRLLRVFVAHNPMPGPGRPDTYLPTYFLRLERFEDAGGG